MNNYELMVIFTPVLSEDDLKAAQKKFADMITENGGEIVSTNPWGLKSLALSHPEEDNSQSTG